MARLNETLGSPIKAESEQGNDGVGFGQEHKESCFEKVDLLALREQLQAETNLTIMPRIRKGRKGSLRVLSQKAAKNRYLFNQERKK